MAGYNGYSMSNNAVAAYESGERPMSKWIKVEILKAIPAEYRESFKKFKVKTLKEILLEESSWHHTSSHYNRTYFYQVIEVDEDNIAQLLETCENQNAIVVIKEEPKKITRLVKYLVWSGTRKHPKAEEITEECEIIGNWAITKNGKKSITAKGFKFLG